MKILLKFFQKFPQEIVQEFHREFPKKFPLRIFREFHQQVPSKVLAGVAFEISPENCLINPSEVPTAVPTKLSSGIPLVSSKVFLEVE